MANPDFVKMISLGEWLSKFLDDDISKWHFRELAKEAVDLLHADYIVNPENKFLKIIESFEPQQDLSLIKSLERWALSQKTYHTTQKLKRESGRNDFYDEMEYYDIDRAFAYQSVLHLINFRNRTFDFMKGLLKSDSPWRFAIAQRLSDRNPNNNLMKIDFIRDLISFYSTLDEIFAIKGDELKKIVVFTLAKKPLTGVSEREIPPFEIMLSRILFDFLSLGGQEYYGFCDYCEKFYVVQRKGRKRFCSDICRTAKQRKSIK